MENNSSIRKEHEQMQLAPGFRFHPTDEELITYYLSHKVLNSKFYAMAIGEADLNKSEPWDFPWRTKMGEKEWYFFCVRDRRYPSGLRTNRATEAGYWKATGKDKEILEGKILVGMKKTLVFYKGRAPKSVKTNWVLHEFRLEGNHSVYNHPKTAKEWVICRVFQKSPSGKKIYISGFSMPKSYGNNLPASVLPPLMDSSPHNSETRSGAGGETSQATCFSDPIENRKIPEEMTDGFGTTCLLASSSGLSPNSVLSSKISLPNSENTNQIIQNIGNLQCSDSFWMQDHSFLKMLLENPGGCSKQNLKAEFSHDLILSTPEMNQDISSSAEEVDLGCLWSYST